jgi:hypothetical protein
MAFEYLDRNKKSRLLSNFFFLRIGISFIVFDGTIFFFAEIHHNFDYLDIFMNNLDTRIEFWNNIYRERLILEINKYLFNIHDVNYNQYFRFQGVDDVNFSDNFD